MKTETGRNPDLECPHDSSVDCYDKTLCDGCRFNKES